MARKKRQGRAERKARLPAVPAVAAISTIAAASTTTTAAISATAATTTAAIATTSAATPRSLGLRAGFVDHKVPATKVLTVQAVDRTIRVFITGNFDEGKAARLARKPVTDQTNCRGINSQLTEPLLQLLF
jgi:hypothetical protein